jgi:hypothetical protein
MLKKILIGIAIIVIGIVGYGYYLGQTTKNHSPEAIAKYDGSALDITVNYCQPYKKGRLIFGNETDGALQPFGKKWRTGANEATEIEFTTDVMISGNTLEKGRYSLYTIPGEDQWVIAFNSNLGYWGAGLFSDPFDETKDALRVEVPLVRTVDVTEQFTISYDEIMDNNVMMILKWDQTQVNIPISKL